ncbi:hypothetical protein BFX06_04845 [Sulfobacillus thermosulfidooxidans]|nr:hypothetical protein BFX05_10270 [Sulfobacillus thermosulfidooxidans]OLZ15266.1 hypothetical protein BFX06_04845 [Sulfobacillus thermosulfidooxidans]OLZ21113.1 hypothetical protein BFX07_13960 [Sulfobacillus thermosulfidooxidans]
MRKDRWTATDRWSFWAFRIGMLLEDYTFDIIWAQFAIVAPVMGTAMVDYWHCCGRDLIR